VATVLAQTANQAAGDFLGWASVRECHPSEGGSSTRTELSSVGGAERHRRYASSPLAPSGWIRPALPGRDLDKRHQHRVADRDRGLAPRDRRGAHRGRRRSAAPSFELTHTAGPACSRLSHLPDAAKRRDRRMPARARALGVGATASGVLMQSTDANGLLRAAHSCFAKLGRGRSTNCPRSLPDGVL
jgi:hypothetical protein